MATISENLQTLKTSVGAIKQAISDRGGDVSGDISTWASSIGGLSGGGSELLTFTMTSFVFFFQDGMTWDEYINITNPNNIGGLDRVYKNSSDNYVHTSTTSILILNGGFVYLTDTILPRVYSTRQIAGGAD